MGGKRRSSQGLVLGLLVLSSHDGTCGGDRSLIYTFTWYLVYHVRTNNNKIKLYSLHYPLLIIYFCLKQCSRSVHSDLIMNDPLLRVAYVHFACFEVHLHCTEQFRKRTRYEPGMYDGAVTHLFRAMTPINAPRARVKVRLAAPPFWRPPSYRRRKKKECAFPLYL